MYVVEKFFTKEQKKIICGLAAKNIRAMRAHLRWSQLELADYTGTTKRRISEIENGKAQMSWTLFLAITAIFLFDSVTPKWTNYSDDALRILTEGYSNQEDLFKLFGKEKEE